MENICEWENCAKVGEFKAPKQRDNSKKHQWLCKIHIKEFNKKWNYFEGMNQYEIEDFLRSDRTWHRPTQEFGSPDNFFNILWNNALSDNFKLFKEDSKIKKNHKIAFSRKDEEAFKIMGLGLGSNWQKIQDKFKILVKKYHPDMNKGNKVFEEKLKTITLAYSHLKNVLSKNNKNE